MADSNETTRVKKTLSAGVIRTDLPMADGRTIRYYDTHNQERSAKDQRPREEQPRIGELRLDPLLNEWVVMAEIGRAHV